MQFHGQFRTDLALEALEHTSAQRIAHHATQTTTQRHGFHITSTHIDSAADATILDKPQGRYCTLSLDALHAHEDEAFARACYALRDTLLDLLPPTDRHLTVLVIGLGNREITPDAIGPQSVAHVFATRHLIDTVPDPFADWHAVCALAPGVLGQTGVEVGEVVRGLTDTLHPDVIVAIDALACSHLSHLLRTVQLTDTGIVPGAGVGNARTPLNRQTLGVPVIAIGVPTVVNGATLAQQIIHEILTDCPTLADALPHCPALAELALPTVVTARDIDAQMVLLARLIGHSINLALHPKMTLEELRMEN